MRYCLIYSSYLTRIRRHRWPVEVYYEEGKAEGLDQYQLRDFGAIEKHVALVAVVYSRFACVRPNRTRPSATDFNVNSR